MTLFLILWKLRFFRFIFFFLYYFNFILVFQEIQIIKLIYKNKWTFLLQILVVKDYSISNAIIECSYYFWVNNLFSSSDTLKINLFIFFFNIKSTSSAIPVSILATIQCILNFIVFFPVVFPDTCFYNLWEFQKKIIYISFIW